MGNTNSSPKDENLQEPKPVKDQNHHVSSIKTANKASSVPLVICYSYIGTGYHGLQLNLQQKTIEKDLLNILVDSKLIGPDAIKSLNKIKWKEGSKTDSGVHSAAQILTFNAHFTPGLKLKDVLPIMKSKTPKDVPIYFWSVISVGNNFNAHIYAEHRQYNYLMPLSTFGDCDLNYLREKIFPLFVGRHNFHNYSKKISSDNVSAFKTITDFSISEPFDLSPNDNEDDGEPYVLWYIRGNSFLINQIRKMLATVISVAHNLLTIEQLKDTFTDSKWALPRLPGDGLFLNKIEYTNFQQKSKKRKDYSEENKDVEFNSVRLSIEKWKKNILFPHIAKIVKKDDIFNKWVNDCLLKYPPEIIREGNKKALADNFEPI